MNLGVFYKKNCTRQSWCVCMIQRQIRVIFGVRFEIQKVDKKSIPTRKLKHADCILE